ncbi:hypothetical protein TRFO_09257 [Tritrichomonas foetus]|uniref:Uncharacterized protein n=1 Tax=Tritrichomonas foetus TaxID=1144522 RepID=A0A1J4JKQ0_9EUKA|nr:hypothetical protein TRFO_09257 [Tritrichomonas foetus]|eukprot:OHS97828.1 hypothetical protein TRFO_09257 [Tritrichomonas foetus]
MWLFQTCETYCPDFYRQNNLQDAVKQLFTAKWDDPSRSSAKYLTNSEFYLQVTKYIFNCQDIQNPIEILQRHGYCMRCDINIFKLEHSVHNFLSITECLMWAYLDRHLPHREMSKIIGKARLSCDSEAILCQWISAIVSKHSHLPPINVIGKQFFSQPYFRIVLFHFTLDDNLMNISDTPHNNAQICYQFCQNHNLMLPFNLAEIEQPPLCILCFLCYVIVHIVKLPVQNRRIHVSDSIVMKKMTGICKLKKEITQINKRCNKLNNEVNMYSKIIKSRPQSVIMKERPKRIPTVLSEIPPKPTARSENNPRIRWDPKVVEYMKMHRTKSNIENKPINS